MFVLIYVQYDELRFETFIKLFDTYQNAVDYLYINRSFVYYEQYPIGKFDFQYQTRFKSERQKYLDHIEQEHYLIAETN